MKNIRTLFASAILSLTVTLTFAQAPQAFNYQAVARNAAGTILAQQAVSFRISIVQNSISGTVVYSETHTATTNDFGLVNLKVGMGTVVSGTFASIAWGGNNHFLRIEMDAAGGSSYQLMGTTQLLSVPYALYAETSGSGGGVTITSTVDNGNGTFTFNYSDGSNFTTGNLTGPAGAAGTTGQNIYEVFGSAMLTVTAATTTYTLIPGMTQTINIPANCKVYVSTNGGLQCQLAGTTTYSVVDIGIFVDGAVSTSGGQRRIVAANTTGLGNMIACWSFGRTYTLAAGNHTFEVKAVSGDAGSAAAGVSSGAAPQIQGVLTVTIVKL